MATFGSWNGDRQSANRDNIALNQSIGRCRSVAELLALTRQRQKTMNLVNCVTSLQRLGKFTSASSPPPASAMEHLIAQAVICFKSEPCQTRHIAGCLWACATLRIAPSQLLPCVLRRGEELQAIWFKPQELSMAVWALGKLVADLASDARALAARWINTSLVPSAVPRLFEFNSQGLSNFVLGLAGLAKVEVEAYVDRLLVGFCGRLHEFQPQEIANTLSSLAKLGARLSAPGCAALSGEMAVAIRGSLRAFTAQHLANVAWATAKLLERTSNQQDHDALNFWCLTAAAVEERMCEFNPQELSMSMWAAAKGLSEAPASPATIAAFASAAGAAVRTLATHIDSAQQVATIVLSLTKLGCAATPQQEALQLLSDAAQRLLPLGHFNPQDLDNLASGFSRHELCWRSRKLVQALSEASVAVLARSAAAGSVFPPRNLANLLTALAKLKSNLKTRGAKERDGTAALSRAAAADLLRAQRLQEFSMKDCANAGWGLAILGDPQPACMAAIGRRAADLLASDNKGFNAQECSRLLYGMGVSGVRCLELEQAAGTKRELMFEFPAPIGSVTLLSAMGGTQQEFQKREDTGAVAGNGGALFEDSFVLAEWLARQTSGPAGIAGLPPTLHEQLTQKIQSRHGWSDLIFVELGAGLGLCSIVAQKMGMRVMATDGDESVLEALRENSERNGSSTATTSTKTTNSTLLQAKLLKWGASTPRTILGLDAPADVIVATGCVYGRDQGVWKALVETVAALSGPDTLVIMAHGTGAAPGTHQMRGEFYKLATPFFDSSRAPQENLHPEHPGVQIHFMARRNDGRKDFQDVRSGDPKGKGKKRKHVDKGFKQDTRKSIPDDTNKLKTPENLQHPSVNGKPAKRGKRRKETDGLKVDDIDAKRGKKKKRSSAPDEQKVKKVKGRMERADDLEKMETQETAPITKIKAQKKKRKRPKQEAGKEEGEKEVKCLTREIPIPASDEQISKYISSSPKASTKKQRRQKKIISVTVKTPHTS
jgi:hypothetical protein